MYVNSVGGNPELPQENGGKVERTTSYSKSIFSYNDKDGKVDQGDLNWQGHIDSNNRFYGKIQAFLEKHNGKEWTASLVSSFTNLIEKYNNQAEKNAEIGVHTIETNDKETTMVSEKYDKNGNKLGSLRIHEDSNGYDVDERDKKDNLQSQIRTRTLDNGEVVTEKIYVDENGNLQIEEISRE